MTTSLASPRSTKPLVTARLSPALFEELGGTAARNERSVAAETRLAIREHLEREAADHEEEIH
jgi:hypothetical protein